ncbi:MAG: hypothetical protein KatS3mg076_2457 [Candidatus Binatia bacterium]|nr:MAG: hypothetical protein KatS3mg076_2457 [Candidatus Binatia bacterium]
MRKFGFVLGSCFLLALSWQSGCGSGSSGFDISPDAEEAAIVGVLETRSCTTLGDLTLCPADEAPASLPPEAMLPENLAASVETGAGETDSLRCLPTEGGLCGVFLVFRPAGFPPETTFAVAARSLEPPGPWVAGSEPLPAEGDPALLGSTVELAPEARRLRFAVLVYLSRPASIPERFERLLDSGADLAFLGERSLLE